MTRMRRSAGTSRARRGRARRKIPLTSTSVWASAAGRSMCATSGAPAPARAAATCSLVSIHGAPCFVRVCRCAATVVELGHGEVKVSYVGWGQEWDEWRKMRLDEIQRTKPASASNATRPAAARLEPVQKALPGKAGAKRKATHVYAPTHFGHYQPQQQQQQQQQQQYHRHAARVRRPRQHDSGTLAAPTPCASPLSRATGTPTRRSTASNTTVTRRIRRSSRMGTRTIRRRVTRAGRAALTIPRTASSQRTCRRCRTSASTSCLSRCRLGSTLSFGPGFLRPPAATLSDLTPGLPAHCS